MSGDVVYDKFHFRHDSKWSGRLGPAEEGGRLLCVACVIEMIESDDIAVRNMMNVFICVHPAPLIHFLWFIGVCYLFALWLWATTERLWRVPRFPLISLGAHVNYIHLICHPHTGWEKVFRAIWYQRGAKVFPGSHEGDAPPGPPSGLAFNGLSAGWEALMITEWDLLKW